MLFSKGLLPDVLKAHEKRTIEAIEKLDGSVFLDANEEELALRLLRENWIEVPILQEDKKVYFEIEEKVLSPEPKGLLYNPTPRIHKQVTVTIPFKGDKSIFQLSTQIAPSEIEGEIKGSAIEVTFSIDGRRDISELADKYQEWVKEVKVILNNIQRWVDEYHEELKESITKGVRERLGMLNSQRNDNLRLKELLK